MSVDSCSAEGLGMAGFFTSQSEASAAVPEPSSLLLGLLGLLLLALRRR